MRSFPPTQQTNPNQSNRRSTVQWYLPLLVFLLSDIATVDTRTPTSTWGKSGSRSCPTFSSRRFSAPGTCSKTATLAKATPAAPSWSSTQVRCYKTFFVPNLRIFRVFVSGKPFQPSLMSTVKCQSLLHKWSTFQLSYSWVGSCNNP